MKEGGILYHLSSLAIFFPLKVKCPSIAGGIAVAKQEAEQSGIARTGWENEAVVLSKGLEGNILGFSNVISVAIAPFSSFACK